MSSSYSEKNVKSYQGLEAIRKRPHMYIGPTDEFGVWTIVREALDNAADEAEAGRNTVAYLSIGKGEYWVADSGGGIPVGNISVTDPVTHKEHKISALKAIVSLTHSGGKFDDTAYKTSRGVHGAGLKATNALSERFQVWTCYDDQWWTTAYEKGVEASAIAKCKAPKLPNGKMPKRGTVIYCRPDKSIFSTLSFPEVLAHEWATTTSYMIPGLQVFVEFKGKTRRFFSEEGPIQFVRDRLKTLKSEMVGKPFVFSQPGFLDCVIAFSNYTDPAMSFYTNGLSNVEGGTHANSFYSSLYKALKAVSKRGRDTFSVHDVKDGVVGLLNIKLSGPEFDSQTKEKLVDARGKKPVEDLLDKAMLAFFKANPKLAVELTTRATRLQDLKAEFKLSKKAATTLKKMKSQGLPANKFAGASHAKPEDRMLYLVEGDSAGGSAVLARDSSFQEVLKLRGKFKNAIRADSSIFDSEEVFLILAAIGFDPNKKVQQLRVGKIVSLADPDPDGPFIGSTPVLSRVDGVEAYRSMAELSELKNTAFEVLCTNGMHRPVWRQAYDCVIVKNVDQLVRLRVDNEVFECDPDHLWQLDYSNRVSKTDSRIVWRGPFSFIRARDLKAGERLASTTPGGALVQKVRQMKVDLTPVYCLTVPQHHVFCVGHNHILSSNCHINTLILSLLYRYIPSLFKEGRVFVCDSPEYYTKLKDGTYLTSKDKTELQKKAPKGVIQHLKGWGEASAELLSDLAFNLDVAKFIRVGVVDKAGHKEFIRLMGADPAYRKEMLGVN